MLTTSITLRRKPKDGKDAVTYEIRLDTDSVVLDSATKQFVTHNLGDAHFIYHQGSYTEDMSSSIFNTYSYIILYYGYEGDVYKVIEFSSNDGESGIWDAMNLNTLADSKCYAMKYIWYDKNLPDNDEVMFKKIWSELDGVPPTELGINILATKMFTVSRNGDSIKSSDVVFGISGSNTQPPTSWKTNFSDLTLIERAYVWTCTKTTLTNGTSYYTGAYCIGDCYNFARVEELYALSDSSTKEPNDGDFSSSYIVVKGKYLWSCVKVTYNNNSILYLNKKCVSYFPTDGTNGTKFTPKGTAYGHYEASSKMPKPSDDVLGLLYLVDKVDTLLTPINKPCVVWWRSFSDSSYMLSYDAAEDGDAYNIGGTLWVHDGKIWHDFGSIQGPKGDDGEDALSIELSTEKILFDYYEGNLDPQNQAITLVVRQGGNVIKSSEYNVKIVSSQNFDIDTDYLTIEKQDSSCTLNCYANGVNTYTYTYNDGVYYVTYPASSCSIKISVEYNGITYFKELSIEVSFVKMYGELYYDTEQLSSTYGELVGEGGRLSTMETNITQNAENIKLTATRTDGLEKQYSEIKVSYNSISAKVASTEKGLLDTGINITDKTIKMTANNFTLYNNKGEETFSADEYGNGVFKGKVTATSGYIGGCEIYDDSYEIEGTSFNYKGLRYQIDADGYMPQHVVNMRDRGFYVGYGDSAMGGYFRVGKTNIMVVSSGGKKELSYGYFFEVSMTTTASVTGQSAYAAKLKAASNKSGIATALEANAYGGKENYAVDAINGDIRVQGGAFIGAFCGNVNNNVTDNYTLKSTDSIIVCNNTKEIKITFPREGIKAGQMFIVIAGTSNKINFGGEYGAVTSILCQTAPWCGTRGQWNYIIFDGNTWHVRMNWQG